MHTICSVAYGRKLESSDRFGKNKPDNIGVVEIKLTLEVDSHLISRKGYKEGKKKQRRGGLDLSRKRQLKNLRTDGRQWAS